jgi:uncharacterized protein YktA (UPF0223 family)
MANLKITDLKAYLKDKSSDELSKEIIELVKLFPDIKQYYTVKINPASERGVFEKYKNIIKNEFFPERGFGKMRYLNVNKAISDFKKTSNNVELYGELLLYYADIGVDFTNEYGDIDERFYLNIEKAYDSALSYISMNDLLDKYYNYASKILSKADGIGWGFTDSMNEIYCQYYSDLED